MHYQMVRCTILCTLVAVATPRFGGASVEMEGFGFEPPPNLFSFVGAPDSVNATPRNTWPVEIDAAIIESVPEPQARTWTGSWRPSRRPARSTT